jgi:hypothetical protein
VEDLSWNYVVVDHELGIWIFGVLVRGAIAKRNSLHLPIGTIEANSKIHRNIHGELAAVHAHRTH